MDTAVTENPRLGRDVSVPLCQNTHLIRWVEKMAELTRPVRTATLIGNGPESLRHVSMVGSNLELDEGRGVCGKEGQSVPVGVGMPTIKIDKMTVGGTA